MADSLILMVLALVVFGPRRLPQIGRQIGKLMYEFRKASNDFKFQMEEELRLAEDADRRKKEEAERARTAALNPPTAATPSVEAQAAVGADDQASVSAQPPVTPVDSGYPSPAVAETASTPVGEEAPGIRYPRINPPSTGEPIAAARPGTADSAGPTAGANVDAEANIGAEASATNGTGETPKGPTTESATEPVRTETVTQHG